MNSSSTTEARAKLERVIQKYPKATAYLVQIVRKRTKPYDIEWSVPKFKSDKRIRRVSGELFYELVTGRATALEELYEAIPLTLDAIVKKHGQLSASDLTAMDDLKETSESHSEASYLKYFFTHAYRNSKK